MATWKKIVYPTAAVILFAGYIALATFVLNTFFKPTASADKSVRSGVYLITAADGEIDTLYDNGETVFNNLDGGLLHSGDGALSSLKLIALYKVNVDAGEIASGGEAAIEISEELAKDGTLAIVHRRDDMSIVSASSKKEVRTKESGERYNVIVFEVSESGYYGIVSQRTVAHYDWLLALLGVATIAGMYFLLFVVAKKLTEKHRAELNRQ